MSREVAETNLPRRAWWPLALVLLVTLLARGGALVAMRQRLNDDPDAYRQLAQGLLRSGVYTRQVELDSDEVWSDPAPTAHRPPLYPLLLTKLASGARIEPLAIGALQLVMGLLTVALVYRLGLDWQLGSASTWGALFVGLDPILINQAVLVMTETLATLLAVVCLWQLTRYSHKPTLANALGAGALLGLAVLCRPTFLPWAGLLSLVMLGTNIRWQWRLLSVAAFVFGMAVVMSPWVVRNYRAMYGQPILTTTHGGYTLLLANNDDFYDYLSEGKSDFAWQVDDERIRKLPNDALFAMQDRAIKTLPPMSSGLALLFDARMNELFLDRLDRELALETIRRRPGMFAYACLVRVYYLWSPLPQRTSTSESTYRALARYLTAFWYLGVYLLALVGIWKLRWRVLGTPWIWGLTLCLALTVIHAVYFSNLRMRAPLMPVVALLAAAAIPLSRPRCYDAPQRQKSGQVEEPGPS